MTPERLDLDELERLARAATTEDDWGYAYDAFTDAWQPYVAADLIAHIRDLEEAREATIRDWWAQVCERAEAKMLQTGKLEGSHYAAATELLTTATPPSPEVGALSAKERQRRSFAYGNAHIDNPNVTQEMVDKAAERLANESPSPEECFCPESCNLHWDGEPSPEVGA